MNIAIIGKRARRALGEAGAQRRSWHAYSGVAARAGDFAELAITLPWESCPERLPKLDLGDKIVFDCTNPLLPNLAGLAIRRKFFRR